MISIFKVQGQSMLPKYREGDFVLTVSFFWASPKIEQDIIFLHPQFGILIKTVSEVNLKENYVKVIGLNSDDSLSSETMGKILFHQIKGRPLFHIKGPRSS